MDKLQHLKTLLEQLQSVTKPVDEDATAPLPECAEAMSCIDELAAERASPGSAAVAAAVKDVLDTRYPGAELNDLPLVGQDMVVFTTNKGADYHTIEIKK